MRTVTGWILFLALLALAPHAQARAFAHPGALLLQADLDRIKAAIAAKSEPVHGAWTAFLNSAPSADRQPHPYAILTDANGSASVYALQNDGHDTYALAVQWALTGNQASGAAAVRILRGWAAALNAESGTPVATMRTGIGMNQMINAAELLRHANGGFSGYTAADIAATERMLRIAVYPILHSAWGAIPSACGPPGACRLPYGDGNWGTAALSGLMAAAVFLGDTAWFDEAAEVYRHGTCASMHRYILDDGDYSGETAESGRDQAHPQFGVGNLLQVAEMAWHQGVDLYGESDNLLLKGVEYLARYGLGNPVPFKAFGTCQMTYTSVATQSRGQWYPIYELAWNHYHNRRGLAAPFTGQVRGRTAPEGSVTDQFGHGTLLYTRPFAPEGVGIPMPKASAGIPLGRREGLSLRVEGGRLILSDGSGEAFDACGTRPKRVLPGLRGRIDSIQ